MKRRNLYEAHKKVDALGIHAQSQRSVDHG